jgi:phosphomevalonate kinase
MGYRGVSRVYALVAVLAALMLASASAVSAQSGSCNIKGNVSTQGERIYHVPGQKYYDDTRISASHGERWFCSEEEARAAGWRRSRV